MRNPNQPPQSSEGLSHNHQVQFNDGMRAFRFVELGTSILLTEGKGKVNQSGHKYANYFGGPSSDSMAIIKTRSGNTYGLVQDLVINQNLQRAFNFPQEPIDITIGERCNIPGVARTTEVESVLLSYKPADMGFGDLDAQEANPFETLQAQADDFHLALRDISEAS